MVLRFCFDFLAFLLVAWFLLVFLWVLSNVHSVFSNGKQNENVYMPRARRGSCPLKRSYWNCKFKEALVGRSAGSEEVVDKPEVLHQLVRSKFCNTRCWFGWFFFNFFSSQVDTTGTSFNIQGKLESPLIKVTLRMTFLSRQSSCVVIVPSQLANHAWLRIIVPTYWVCTLGLFTQLQNQFLP